MKIQKSTKNKWLGALTFSFALACSMAVATVVSPAPVAADVAFEVKSASLSLSDDLAMNYYVSVPDGYNVTGTVTYKEQQYSVAPTDTQNANEKVFRFEGITPQNMAEEVKLTVFVTDQEVAPIEYTYSVKEYCVSVLDMTTEQLNLQDKENYTKEEQLARLKTLATDILNYGAAAQEYTGYRTDDLVNEDVDQTYASTFIEDEPIDSYAKLPSLNGNTTSELAWAGARLYFDSYIGLEVAFMASSNFTAADFHVRFQNTWNTTHATVRQLTEGVPTTALPDGWSWYVARLSNVKATDFNTVYEMSICNTNDEQWQDVPRMQYSVSSYVARNQDETNNALERALFTYGKSAFCYGWLQDVPAGVVDVQPTFTEEGHYTGRTHGGYIVDQATNIPTLSTENAYERVSITDATVENDTLIEGKATYVLKSNSSVKFDKAIDHVIALDGETYNVYDLPEGASYDVANDTVTVALNGVNYTQGILAWGKSVTFTVTGENTVSGFGKNQYAVYEKGGAKVIFAGDGTLNVNDGGIRTYANTEVNGTKINVNVAKNVDGSGNIYSDGFKAESGLALNNATLNVTATTDVDPSVMDKSGLVFGSLTVENSTATVNNFAFGLYMNGDATLGTGGTLAVNNAIRYGATWWESHTITVGGGATLNLSIIKDASGLINDISKIVMQESSTVNLSLQNDGNGFSNLDNFHIPNNATATITLHENIYFGSTDTVTLKAENGVSSVLLSGAELDSARVLPFNQVDGKTLTLYTTYSTTGFVNNKPQETFGYYAYNNGASTRFLYFWAYFMYESPWTTTWKSTVPYGNNSGVGESAAGDVLTVTYDNTSFTNASRWQAPIFGI